MQSISKTAVSYIRRQSISSARSFAPSSLIAGDAFGFSRQEPQQKQPQRHVGDFTPFQIRSFSSHDDFAPVQKQKPPSEIDEAIEMIRQHVEDNPVMLYMKGSPSMPMCGFSAKMVQTLQAEGIDFSSVNVLDYPSIREGVKQFASWPTIPQLYVNGEFIGGIDIVSEMHESGELKDLLAEAKSESESKE